MPKVYTALAPIHLRTPRFPKARAEVKRPPAKARPTVQEANERPRYPALARGIARQERQVQRAMRDLRRTWLAIVRRQPEPDGKSLGAKNLNIEDGRELDAAIEAFLQRMAGPSRRDPHGFAAADGLVQETNILAHRIGVARGAEQVNVEANPELTRLQQQALLERSFERLSEDGRLRFEARLDAIKERMLEGFANGESPLKIAKDLGENLDGYHQGRLRTIVRTEAAFASERAIIDTYRQAGVTQYTVTGDPTTDQPCLDAQNGGPYDLGDEEFMPPIHPSCFCTTLAVLPD